MALPALLEPDLDLPRYHEPEWMTELRRAERSRWATVSAHGHQRREHLSQNAIYILSDASQWLTDLTPNSIHAIVTDPPYGVIEYEEKDHKKLRAGRGGFGESHPPSTARTGIPSRASQCFRPTRYAGSTASSARLPIACCGR